MFRRQNRCLAPGVDTAPSVSSDTGSTAWAAVFASAPCRQTCRLASRAVAVVLIVAASVTPGLAQEGKATAEPLAIWPGLAPGETSMDEGRPRAPRPGENPPATRIEAIRRPTLDVYLPDTPTGAAVLILPGGGYSYVVVDKEGSEVAHWLNGQGIAAFVLRYRTRELAGPGEPHWRRPLQDAQRAMRLIRSRSEEWSLDSTRIGVIGFSAGGQTATLLHTMHGGEQYEPLDEIDQLEYRPNFAMLIYPWRILDEDLGGRIDVSEQTPPTFLVHTHDDHATSLGSAMLYVKLKRAGASAELHVFESGGHGYGTRTVEGANVHEWTRLADAWLSRRGQSSR